MGEKEVFKTSLFFGAVVVLITAAYLAQPRARNDAGPGELGLFFPELTDVEKPKAMEITEYDEKLDKFVPFKVEKKNGSWRIPSHSNYPADAEDRLKKTAAALFGLKKDSVQSMSKDDQVEMGVADPTESTTTKGTGKLIKLFDESNNVLAALIVGKEMKDRPGFRFMRMPESPVIYAVDAKDLDLSNRFSDWINTKLFETTFDFDRITEKDYNVTARGLEDRGTITLQKDPSGDFLADGVGAEEETNKDKAREIASSISDLKILGVRKKPAGLQPNLRTVEGVFQREEMQDLGFILHKGTIYAVGGDVIAESKDGIVVTTRFGGVSLETGDALSAGKKGEKAAKPEDKSKKDAAKNDGKDAKKAATPNDDAAPKTEEGRYLLITVSFDKSKFPEIPDLPPEPAEEAKKEFNAKKPDAAKPGEKKAEPKPEDVAKQKEEEKKRKEEDRKRKEEDLKFRRKDREQKMEAAEKKAKEMQRRYDEWYYVIPNDAYKKIRLSRADLIGPKKPKAEPGAPDFSVPNSPLNRPITPPPAKKAEPTPTETKKAPAKDAKADLKSDAKAPPAKPADASKPGDKKPDAANKPATPPAKAPGADKAPPRKDEKKK